MATTTTNYGFDVPTSSDLVKNGATQIALLGQDLDTFLFRPFTRNGVLNSGMNVWQRGTSVSVAASATPYTADRWQVFTNASQACTVSRQLVSDSTNLPNIQYAARVQRNSGQTGTGGIYFSQNFESINSVPFAGKTITFSFYARAGANYSAASSILSATMTTGTGTDQNLIFSGYTGAAYPVNTNATLTTTWQRFTYTGTVASTANEICLYFGFIPVGTAGANDYFDVTGVQLEVGNQASPYAPATPTYATELAACQRYYWFLAGGTSDVALANMSYYTATDVRGVIQFPVTMRVSPTAVSASGTNFFAVEVNGAKDTLDFLSATRINPQAITVFNQTNALSVAGFAGYLITNSASASLAFSAEL